MLGDKTRVELTEKEVDILKCLINSGEEAVDRDELLKQVWNYSSDVTTHTLETHIYRLRQKLETDPSIPLLIISKGGSFAIRSN
jgi:DNA-binding response OmpR family regulator